MKRTRLSELKRGIYVKTKWGNMRPSWHIQCAAMSMKYLGESFDIHTSTRELAFPHHENEIAIAQAATGKSLAKYWMHCDLVLVDGKKVATENISGKKDGQFIDIYYPVESELSRDKNKILVRFEPHRGHRAGPIFGARTITR